MITIEQYFRDFPHTEEQLANAEAMLAKVNKLIDKLMADRGILFHVNPATGCLISGETFGGFRPQDCPIGAPMSNHKQGHAVDIYDPDNKIDDYLYSHTGLLIEAGIYLESTGSTPGWSHWQDVAPKSGNRIFYP